MSQQMSSPGEFAERTKQERMRLLKLQAPDKPVRTDRSRVADLAVNYVANVFAQMNWNVNRLANDIGIDLHVDPCAKYTGECLPWAFDVQVKGTSRLRVVRGEVVFRTDTKHVQHWIQTTQPVLFVVCHIQGCRVSGAYFAWVDQFVYGSLRWPILDDSFVSPKYVSLRFALKPRFTKRCREQLLEYLREWRPIAVTEEGIRKYLRETGSEIQEKHKKRRYILNWSLNALPISYERRTFRGKTNRADSAHQLLRFGERRISLLGRPGSGKTTTIDRLLAQAPEKVIPVAIREFLPAASKTNLCDEIMRKARIANRQHLEYLERQGRLLLIVDGLNEFHDYAAVMKNISDLSLEMRRSRFLVACRTFEYDDMPKRKGFDEWEIVNLDDSQQDAFIGRQTTTVGSIARRYFKSEQVRKMCRTHFVFLIALEEIRKRGRIPLRRVELLEVFLNRYLEWVQKPRWVFSDIFRLLSEIAVAMRSRGLVRTSIGNSELTRLIKKTYDAKQADFIKQRLYKQALLEKQGRHTVFFQEMIQEYLCARWLVESGALPCSFRELDGRQFYEDLELTDEIRSFYIELGEFESLVAQKYRARHIWR